MRRRELLLVLGGAMTAARSLHAQQKAMPVIGYLASGSPSALAPLVAAFHQGLIEAGYVEGQNVAIEYRWAEGHYDRLPALAADLVGRKVDVIAAGGMPLALAAKSATSTIPIVFMIGTDRRCGGRSHEKAGFHYFSRRRDDGGARAARPAEGDAGDRLP